MTPPAMVATAHEHDAGLDRVLVDRIRREIERIGVLDDRAKLSLPPAASPDDAKKAYERLASDLQPERFRSHGVEVLRLASELASVYRDAATRLGAFGAPDPSPGQFNALQDAPLMPLGGAVASQDVTALRARAESAEKKLAELHFQGLRVVDAYRTERARAQATEAALAQLRARTDGAEQLALKQKMRIKELEQKIVELAAQLGRRTAS